MADDPKFPPLTIRALRGTPVEVPLNYVLGTSAVAIRKAPLLLVDLETEQGVTGRTYLFCYLPAAAPAILSLLEVEAARRAIIPAELWKKLARRFTLIGVQGIVRMAMSAFDAASWDARNSSRQATCSFIGATPRNIPAYNSCGLGLKDDLVRSRRKPKNCSPGLSRRQASLAIRRCKEISRPFTRYASVSATCCVDGRLQSGACTR
jgi:L-alanine-DL-glutamate epimerase-like enolase superfamily enzyme